VGGKERDQPQIIKHFEVGKLIFVVLGYIILFDDTIYIYMYIDLIYTYILWDAKDM